MKRVLILAACVCAATLTGCATEYQSRNLSGGYREEQSGPDTWFIGFSGNGYTTRETVQTFWLYRAAELMLKKPFAANPPRIFDAQALKNELDPIVKGKLCSDGNVCPHVHGYLRPPL